MPFDLYLNKKLCEKALILVRPDVTALVFIIFGIIVQFLYEERISAFSNQLGFYRFCAEAAQTAAEDLGRILNRMI